MPDRRTDGIEVSLHLEFNYLQMVHICLSLVVRQNALLAAISEKDANIALLETSSSKDEQRGAIQSLRCEKDQLVVELKEWVGYITRYRWKWHTCKWGQFSDTATCEVSSG